MTREDQERINQLVHQIETEQNHEKLMALMQELNEFLGEREAQVAIMRAGKPDSR